MFIFVPYFFVDRPNEEILNSKNIHKRQCNLFISSDQNMYWNVPQFLIVELERLYRFLSCLVCLPVPILLNLNSKI